MHNFTDLNENSVNSEYKSLLSVFIKNGFQLHFDFQLHRIVSQTWGSFSSFKRQKYHFKSISDLGGNLLQLHQM